MPKRDLKVTLLPPKEATRRWIQHIFLDELKRTGYVIGSGAKEPNGIQARVIQMVNETEHQGQFLKTNKAQVSDWVGRLRQNGYCITSVLVDYSRSSQNGRVFFEDEQRRIREEVHAQKLKSHEVTTVYSDRLGGQVAVSPATVRRALKRKGVGGRPGMVAAVPKGMKVGGDTAHHNKCRLLEAQYWLDQGQDFVDNMFFADASKITFKEHHNRMIDIEWAYRGEAGDANWFQDDRWPGQINLFILQSRNGIEWFHIYDKTMKKADYVAFLSKIARAINRSPVDMSCYLHDNLWRQGQPTEELDRWIGEGMWTQYMGVPCTKNHPTALTPVTKRPKQIPLDRCTCVFPEGPIKAAYNPKTNLTENSFAQIDRIMRKNKIDDEKLNPPRRWIRKGANKKKWWRDELIKAINQLNADKDFFRNQHAGFLERCRNFTRRDSRGKRLKVQRY